MSSERFRPASKKRAETTLAYSPWGALTALLIVFLIHTWNDPDIWYHLNFGRLIWQNHDVQPQGQFILHQNNINIYWLYQLIVLSVFKLGGTILLSTADGLLWLGIATLWLRITRPQVTSIAGFLLAFAAVLICQSRFLIRSDEIAWLILLGQIYILSEASPSTPNTPLDWRRFSLLVFLEALTANIHGYFVFGVTVFGAYLLSRMTTAPPQWRTKFVKVGAMMLGLLMVSTLISPFGWKTWKLFLLYTSQLYSPAIVSEATKPQWHHWIDTALYVFAFATTAVVIYQIVRNIRRRTFNSQIVFSLILGLAGIFLAFQAIRTAPFLVIFSAPLWRETLPLIGRHRDRARRSFCVLATALCLCLTVTVLNGSLYNYMRVSKRFGTGPSPYIQPVHAKAWLDAHMSRQLVFNDPTFGGWLAWNFPQGRYYGFTGSYDSSETLEYFRALTYKDDFYRLDSKYHFDFVLFDISLADDLPAALLRDPQWHLVYADLLTACWSRVELEPQYDFSDYGLPPRILRHQIAQWRSILPEQSPAAINFELNWRGAQ